MSAEDANDQADPGGKTAAEIDRQERLARALRDNLARRKAQARSRRDEGDGTPESEQDD